MWVCGFWFVKSIEDSKEKGEKLTNETTSFLVSNRDDKIIGK